MSKHKMEFIPKMRIKLPFFALLTLYTINSIEVTQNLGLFVSQRENIYIQQGPEATIKVHSPVEIRVDGNNKDRCKNVKY